MCTVTVLHTGDLLRVAVNRDESRRRPAAHPPFISRAGAMQVLMPQDPRGRGTWIAANGAGLVFALLNLLDDAAVLDRTPSRGLIIPAIAESESLEEAARRIEAIPSGSFAPCRVLVIDACGLIDVRLIGRRTVEVHALDCPLLFTSSSLGDALVEGPRRMLFEQMLPSAPLGGSIARDLAARQDAFHAHRWRDRPAVSVHMSRSDACTVSTTIVEASPREVRMLYQPAHCDAGTPVGLIIDRQGVADGPPRARREHAAV
jgi:hypothetical protein